MALTNMTNVTNIAQVVIQANSDTNMLMFGGLSIMIFIILLVGFMPSGSKNAIIAASVISLLLNIFMFFMELIPLYLITFYVITTAGGVIYRVFGGE